MPFWPDRFKIPTVRSGPAAPAFVGPLDGYETGLMGVWSVARRLLSSYHGPLIRVRNDAAEELDIHTDGHGSLQTAALLSFAAGGNAFVTKVYDQSGVGNELEQPTALSQALIVDSGAVIEIAGGRPGMRHNGTFAGYTASLGQQTPSAVSYSYVGIPSLAGGYNGQLGGPGASFAPNGSILLYSPSDTTLQNFTAFSVRGSALTVVAGDPAVAGVSVGPAAVTHYAGGTPNTPGSYTPGFDFDTFGIWSAGVPVGGTVAGVPAVAEMILWTGERSGALSALGAEQADYFSI